MSENRVISSLLMDRSEPIGNSDDGSGRRALHIRPTSGTLVTEPYDQIQVTYPNDVTEVYTYLLSSIPTVSVTVIYLDDTKNELSNVTKTIL